MDFLNNLFLPPSATHLQLVKYMILLVYFIHIPFISLLFGGLFYSLYFRVLTVIEKKDFYLDVSRDFADILIFRKSAGIFLGVLPLIILTLIEGQVFYDAPIQIVSFMIYTTILAAVGISLAYFYQSTFRTSGAGFLLQLFSGGFALIFLIIAYYIFWAASALVLDPGRWFIITQVWELLFSWNAVARFLHFITASFAVTGAALLFFFFNWRESRQEADPEYASYMRKVGGGIALAFTLLQPIFIFWNLATIPSVALSAPVYALSILVLILMFFISMTLYLLLRDHRVKLGTNAFMLFIFTFLVMIVNDHVARESATQNQTQVLVTRAEEVQSKLKAEREAQMTSAEQPDVQLGEKIYNEQCSTCHQFDKRVVGPAYNSVLPQYSDKREELVKFVRNPYKINPDYPPMPNLGLTDHQAQSVIAYLYKHFEEEKNKK